MTNFALNPFKKGKKTEVEGVRKVEIENDPRLEEVIKQYMGIKDQMFENEFNGFYDDLKTLVLPPNKINLFLDYVLHNNIFKEGYFSSIKHQSTGQYITKLIQTSYDAGHNNFTLNTQGNIGFLLCYLSGKKDNLLKVNILGNTSDVFANHSKYCDFNISGDVSRWLGVESKYCNFFVDGNLDLYCGYKSENCTYEITKNVTKAFGNNTKNTVFILHSNNADIYDDCHHEKTIMVSNKDCYNRIAEKSTPAIKLYLIDKEKNILEEHKHE